GSAHSANQQGAQYTIKGAEPLPAQDCAQYNPEPVASQAAPRPAHAVFFPRGHTVVTTSATAIPSDTSRNRCHPMIQGARARGISKIMLSAIPANRQAPPTRN